jgi:cystathionine beta-lyase/cystathionine gamma-synthase
VIDDPYIAIAGLEHTAGSGGPYDLYRRQMGAGAGGLLSLEVEGGIAAAEAVMANMRVAHRSASFGSFASFAVHPAAMWSGMMSEEQLRESGLPPGLVRLGVGFEDPAAIALDIEAALAFI